MLPVELDHLLQLVPASSQQRTVVSPPEAPGATRADGATALHASMTAEQVGDRSCWRLILLLQLLAHAFSNLLFVPLMIKTSQIYPSAIHIGLKGSQSVGLQRCPTDFFEVGDF